MLRPCKLHKVHTCSVYIMLYVRRIHTWYIYYQNNIRKPFWYPHRLYPYNTICDSRNCYYNNVVYIVTVKSGLFELAFVYVLRGVEDGGIAALLLMRQVTCFYITGNSTQEPNVNTIILNEIRKEGNNATDAPLTDEQIVVKIGIH